MKEAKQAFTESTSKESIQNDLNFVETLKNMKEIINALTDIAVILNKDRKIIFINNAFLDFLKIKSIEEVLGFKLGEAINCINSQPDELVCGTMDSCRFCDSFSTITEAQQNNLTVTKEAKFVLRRNNHDRSFDFLVSAIPLTFHRRQYIILSLKDISWEKKHKSLERVFFHDILNTAGNVQNIVEIMKDIDDPEKFRDYLDLIFTTNRTLIDEIISHRTLIAAENSELKPDKNLVSTGKIIKDAVSQSKCGEFAKNRYVVIDESNPSYSFNTDPVLLKRILINMLKNALEATPERNGVTIGSYIEDKNIIFWVRNESEIPKEDRHKIFMRFFSTKGGNRGLGTYSIKLLTERYLGGEAKFTSDKINGTKFFVKLPVQ